jgi:hypothetical protein
VIFVFFVVEIFNEKAAINTYHEELKEHEALMVQWTRFYDFPAFGLLFNKQEVTAGSP